MGVHTIRRGLDLPIAGVPAAQIEEGAPITRVALIGLDHVGMKPRMIVEVGERVLRGQPLFEDRQAPGVLHTAPGTGTVRAIHRGDKRAFLSMVIDLDDGAAETEQVAFAAYTGRPAAEYQSEAVEALLIESGLWAAIVRRPFGRSPLPGTRPEALFITAIDSRPHAPDVAAIVKARRDDFAAGLTALRALVSGKVFLCVGAGAGVDACGVAGVDVEAFAGKHPAGLVGTHMHLLSPASIGHEQWAIGAQDVLAIGALFRSGRLDVQRVVAIGGPAAQRPRHVRTRLGADLQALTDGECAQVNGDVRVVSGSVLDGRAAGDEVLGYLGRFHEQVSLIGEGRQRELLGWLTPGLNSFSTARIYLSSLLGGKRFAMDTNTRGSQRAMVPIGMYERVMPLDILPTFLLRSLLVGDIEQAQKLGALELCEEDLALCTFVCPGKNDYGELLRACLAQIEKEG